MKCKCKHCIENWASDDQWAFDENGICARCNFKMTHNLPMNECIPHDYKAKKEK